MMPQYSALATDLERIRRFLTSGSEDRQTSDQRRFAYIACISALYASFENFAERVAFRFGEMLLANPANPTVEQIANLRKRCVRNASTLFAQGLGVGRYEEVTELDVARSLASCLDDSGAPIDLRLELVSYHSSNLRWESLAELFSWAASSLHGKIQNSDAVRNWMSLTLDVSESTLAGTLKNELDDLVERRNEVAHRAIPEEILSHEHLLAKVSYIEAISLGLVASLASMLIECSIDNNETTSLGSPTEILKDKRVIVIPSLQTAVSEGDHILARGANSIRWGRVLEVMVDSSRVPRADAGVEVGLLLNFAVQKKPDIHLWPNPIPDLTFLPKGIFGNQGPAE